MFICSLFNSVYVVISPSIIITVDSGKVFGNELIIVLYDGLFGNTTTKNRVVTNSSYLSYAVKDINELPEILLL